MPYVGIFQHHGTKSELHPVCYKCKIVKKFGIVLQCHRKCTMALQHYCISFFNHIYSLSPFFSVSHFHSQLSLSSSLFCSLLLQTQNPWWTVTPSPSSHHGQTTVIGHRNSAPSQATASHTSPSSLHGSLKSGSLLQLMGLSSMAWVVALSNQCGSQVSKVHGKGW